MGISNQIPNSRISQAGVVPNEAARPASPYDGQVIYQQDTDRTLVWNGTAWVDVSTGQTGRSGLVKIVPSGATNGTVEANGDVTIGNSVSSVTVNGAFSSAFNNYKITVSGGAGSTEAILIFYFTGTSSGYYRAANGYRYDNVGVIAGGSANVAFFTCGFMTSSSLSYDLEVVNPASEKVSLFRSMYAEPRTSAGSGAVMSSGFHNSATAYSNFVMQTGAGTMTGGTIRVYGYN